MHTTTLRRFLNHTASTLLVSAIAIVATTATATGDSSSSAGAASPATQPDNTKRNNRDYGTNEVSPFDQGNSEADLKTTQEIRKAVMRQDGLSSYARNVKIVTRDGQVVLRGPVRSSEEKLLVENAAKQIAGEANVRSQLEVKIVEGRPASPETDSRRLDPDTSSRPADQTDRPSTRNPAP